MATVNRQAHVIAARIVGNSGATKDAAQKVLKAVLAVAAGHKRTGDYISHFKIVPSRGKGGVLDHLVVNDDPAVGAIEFGRVVGGRRVQALRIMSRGVARVK